MRELSRLIRRWVIRWQLRHLDQQVETIVGMRNQAQARLKEIKRERGIKEVELWLSHLLDTKKSAA